MPDLNFAFSDDGHRIWNLRNYQASYPLPSMEYRGFGFSVVQTISPTGWKWTVDLLPLQKSRTGDTFSKEDGVRRARAVIDQVIIARNHNP